MARYQVILAYDGTDFSGFQRQAKARTVQGEVESALRQLGWRGRAILSAGRTDTGVHAVGQVIAFDLDWGHTLEELRCALNAYLPRDVAARAVRQALPDFQPRYQALSRRYCYRIFCDPVRNPLRERYAWRVWPPVEVPVLEQAAQSLQGKHDFAAFGSPPRAKGSTVRTVFSAQWRSEGDRLVFDVVADAFLYHMVRRMVSLQVEIGQGNAHTGVIHQYLGERKSSPIQRLAPPQGLILVEVRFRSSESNFLEMSEVSDRCFP